MLRTLAALLMLSALVNGAAADAWAKHRRKEEKPKYPPGIELRENFYEDGAPQTQWLVRVSPDGSAVRHGHLLRYHHNGRLALRAAYRDGEPTGVWSWFDEAGKLLRTASPQGDYDAIIRGHDIENPNMVHEDPVGRRVAEGTQKYGKAHGLWTYYHLDGSVSAHGHFINGLPDGRWRYYYGSGQVQRQEEYKLGVPHGAIMEGYRNGQERVAGRMEFGLRVGTWRTWFDNGQVESEGQYAADRRTGIWRFYDVLGALQRVVRYAKGEVAEDLPLHAVPRALPPPQVVPHPETLPFRPRIYDETGVPIQLQPH